MFSFPIVNPLNAELNPICPLLALLGAHHILYISRIRVNQHKFIAHYVETKCESKIIHKIMSISIHFFFILCTEIHVASTPILNSPEAVHDI